MKIMIVLIVFLASCTSSKEPMLKQAGGGRVELQLQRIGQIKHDERDIAINFLVINTSSSPVYVNNPKCWGSSHPIMKFNNKELFPTIKVKPDPACAKQLVFVKDSVLLKYDYTLDQFVDFSNLGNYQLQFQYKGAVYNEKMEKLEDLSILTNAVSFSITR